MRYDGYAGAVDADRLQQCLEHCQATDRDHPGDIERCAHDAVQACSCPCIASEEMICNSLARSVSETMFRDGFGH